MLGGVTGARYYLPQPDAIVSADPRDRRSISAVPRIRQIAAL